MNDFLDELYQNIDEYEPVKISEMKLASLVYADDILLLSETQAGIIKQIKSFHNFCLNNSLKINYSKTKIMVFNETQKYHELIIKDDKMSPIEVVNEYKYLGIWIAKNDRKQIEELAKKGKSSSYLTAKTLKEFKTVDGTILTETFEILTLSKMRYGCELYFDKNLADLNRIIMQFFKRFHHLRISTPNYCIIGEFGIKPMEFHCYKAAINYFLKLNEKDDKRLINRMYRIISDNLDAATFRNTWCDRINKLFNKIQLHEMRNLNSNGKSKRLINNALTEYFRAKWINNAKTSNKGMKYLELCRFQCELKSYLTEAGDQIKINAILKLRTGNHTLAAEIGTYQNRDTYEDYACKFCDQSEIEDIYHFIVGCPRYKNERNTFIPYLKDGTRSDFYEFMNTLTMRHTRSLGDYIHKAMETRNYIMKCSHSISMTS